MTTPITPIKDLEPSLVAALKAEVLTGKSIYAVSQAHKINPLTLSRALIKDPDIVKAKAAGVIRQRKGGAPAKKDYTKLPYVIDVLENGMTTVAAAKKHGISQPVVWQKVKAAREYMEAAKAAAPPTPPQTTPNNDLDFLVDIVRSYATRTNQRPETVAHQLRQRLAD